MQTLRQLFAQTDSAGTLDSARLQQIERVLVEDHPSDTPWYVSALIAFGAWLASAFFIGFFIILFGWQDEHRTSIGTAGLVLLAAAIAVYRLRLGLFANQCCLAFSLAGQFMIYYSFLPTQNGALECAVIFSIGLAAVLYFLYPDVLHRLLTCLAALQITLAWVHFENSLSFSDQARPDIVLYASGYWILHLIALAGCCLVVSRRSADLAPLGYAVVISLAAWQLENLGGVWTHDMMLFDWPKDQAEFLLFHYVPPISSALMLLGSVTWAAGGTVSWKRHPLPFAALACALFAIIWLGAGGVLLSLVLITLGFFIESTVVRTIGLLLLPIFLSSYYYNLHLDLLAKSVALVGSGLALLLLRIGTKQWLRTEFPETL